MEHNDPSRRQYVPHNYSAQQAQPGAAPTSGQYGNPGPVDRFRQSAYLQEPPATPPSVGRPGADAQQVYGFTPAAQYGAQNPMQPSALQYGQELQSPEAQRQQSQQYQQYGGQVLYSMGPPPTTQPQYEQVSNYRPRSNTTSETLGSQFGVAQSSQYYLAGQPSHGSASAAELPAPTIPSQYAQQDPYPQPGPSNTQPYPTSIMDPVPSNQYQTYVQQAQQQAPLPATMDQEFQNYESQIRATFSLARDGSLRDIATHLLDASQYLLGKAEAIGLTKDPTEYSQAFQDNRVRLWDEFNRAWLVTLQRQFDMTQEILRTNQQPREPQSIMNTATLERMGQELVRLCDLVEKHGLVDYQIGVAEEDIIDLLLRCIALLEPSDEGYMQGAQ